MFLEAIHEIFSSRDASEKPLTSLSLARMLTSGQRSSAGIVISNDSVLGNPFVYRGLQMISSDVSKLPVWVYERQDEGSREQLRNHPVSRLLNVQVNATTKPNAFLRTMIGHALLHRGGYAEILRSPSGRVELELLDPNVTYPVDIEARGLQYQTRNKKNQERLIPAENVFHVRGLGFDTFDSYSVLDKLKEALGLGLAQQKYASVYFKNNAQPKLVIRFPGQLKTEEAVERFRNSWGELHGGVDNSHRPAILEGGAEVDTLTPNAEETQLKELREMDGRIVATILGVPPHKLGDPTRTSFASLEQENQSYLDQAIDPWLREIESESNFKLLGTQFPDRFVEFNREALVRMNFADKMAGFNTAIQAGFLSRNEARRKLNMNDAEGLDDYFVPLNMGIAGEEPPEPEQPPPAPPVEQEQPDEEDDRLARVVAALIERMLTRAMKYARKPDQLFDKNFDLWVETFEPVCGLERAQQVAQEILLEMARDYSECSGDGIKQVMAAHRQDMTGKLSTLVQGENNGKALHTANGR